MRSRLLLLSVLLFVGLAAGCGGDSDKKGVNRGKDKPVPQPPKAALVTAAADC